MNYFHATVISAPLPITWVCLRWLPWINPKMAYSILLAPQIPTIRSRGENPQSLVTSCYKESQEKRSSRSWNLFIRFKCDYKHHYVLFAVSIVRIASFDI